MEGRIFTEAPQPSFISWHIQVLFESLSVRLFHRLPAPAPVSAVWAFRASLPPVGAAWFSLPMSGQCERGGVFLYIYMYFFPICLFSVCKLWITISRWWTLHSIWATAASVLSCGGKTRSKSLSVIFSYFVPKGSKLCKSNGKHLFLFMGTCVTQNRSLLRHHGDINASPDSHFHPLEPTGERCNRESGSESQSGDDA